MAAVIPSSIPSFTYTGSYEKELREDWGWVIRFKTSGTLTFTKDQKIDVHILGGGGGGGAGNASVGGGGGGGYQTIKFNVPITAGTEYAIVVGTGASSGYGNDGKASSAFGYSAAGGKGGGFGDSKSTWASGGAGGTGSGGTRDYDGGSNTVREFAMPETSWPLYGGGGAAGNSSPGSPYGGKKAAAATGYGGGGGGSTGWNDYTESYGSGGAGYQGIVSIRNAEVLELPVKFNNTTLLKMTFNGEEVKSLIFNGTTIFMERLRRWLKWLSVATTPSAQRAT